MPDHSHAPVLRAALAALLPALCLAGARPAAGQITPTVFYACYIPTTGTVYRIKTPETRTDCTTSKHIEFSWTDGIGAIRIGDAAGGDLSGVFPNPTVAKLLGRALATTPPTAGQVLTWTGTEWAPTTPVGGVTDHGGLTGLTDDDHPQYLLGDGLRSTTNGFAVTGTLNAGTLLASGQGVRLLWYPRKAAFRAGHALSTQWDDAYIGRYSSAMGNTTMASGDNSTALGLGSTASGYTSTAIGNFTTASNHSDTAMGQQTTASGGSSTAMGFKTTASGMGSVAMGTSSTASGQYSIAVGNNAIASGVLSSAMGEFTIASGANSTASGSWASTNYQPGAFVYGDNSTTSVVMSPAPNSFTVRAAGGTTFYSNSTLTAGVTLAAGAGAWTTVSDVNRKHLFREESGEAVLQKVAGLTIRSWSYQSQDPSIRHLGPTAQDFRAAFGLGESDLGITTTDIDGVNLLAVQALEKRTRELRSENAKLRAENEELKARVQRLEELFQRLTVERKN